MCQCTLPSTFVGFQMNFRTMLATLTTVLFRCFEPRNSVVLNPEKESVHEVFAKSDMENRRECQLYRGKNLRNDEKDQNYCLKNSFENAIKIAAYGTPKGTLAL